jgi:iron-sulfur cluster assembly protein
MGDEGSELVLTMTETAIDAVDSLVASTPASTGIRISHGIGADGKPGLTLALVEEPEPSDQVVEVEGEHASVFLEQEAAAVLHDKVLDAAVQEGQVGFAIAEQGSPPAQ